MTKLVSIIVPFRDEDERQLEMILSNINNQIGIDFSRIEVVLVSDGGMELDESGLNDAFENLNIRFYYYAESKGLSMARSVGMDLAVGQYVMFMDPSDQLYFVGALLEFFNAIKYHGDHQIIGGKYLEQLKFKDEFRYITHENDDNEAVMGKWFNVEYLENLGLDWLEKLSAFEDAYFVRTACELADDRYSIDSLIYMQLWSGQMLGQQNNSMLDQWAYAQRHVLEKIAAYKPQNLIDDLKQYMSDLYLRMQLFPAQDKAQFEVQQQKLLKEFENQWTLVKPKLGETVEEIMKQSLLYRGMGHSGLDSFIENQEQLLSAAMY
ncbi:MAG: glycosyltransferase family 2 protein [Lactobacillus sp.]|nr:MAG: glycosyltransferase family 2 protein [Lactobacillus sp.]